MKKNVLIFPCGAENAIEIYKSLRHNLHFNVYGMSGKKDHGCYIYNEENYIEGNFYVSDVNFLSLFNSILEKYKIDIIIPTHDTVALFLAKNKDKIKSKVMVSEYKTALIAREKKLTFELFEKKWYCPKIYKNINEKLEFPIFLKPNIGEGAKGTFKISSQVELDKLNLNYENMVISEYLPGEEITVDCFTNRFSELLFVGPRTRNRIQMGIAFNSKSLELTEEIFKIAKDINESLNLRGPWFFQLKKDKNKNWKLMEISVRQAGTMGLYRQLGINFALLGLFDLLDKDIKILKNNIEIELDRYLKAEYKINYRYKNVYVDFDDTLIVNNKVNTDLMKFIYQCINKKINVFLITKHINDIKESLKKYKISKDIFNEIFLLKDEEKKSLYIDKDESIFIDNYFLEREEVLKSLNIPVFNVDAIEALISEEE